MQATLRGVARAAGLVSLAALTVASDRPALASTWESHDGVCTEAWSKGELLRGPEAIVGGVLLPLRSLAGGLVYGGMGAFREPSTTGLVPLWIVGSTVYGVAEGVWWIASGALDTVSGGAFLLSPPEASEIRVDPVVPFIGGEPRGERCRSQASPVAIGTSSASPHSAHDPS